LPQSSQASSLHKQGLAADALSSDGAAHDPLAPFFPFGDTTPHTAFTIKSSEAFLKPGALVTISVALDPDRPPVTASGDLTLTWQYNAGGTGSLGSSTPALGSASPSGFQFNDGTKAFTQPGQISFRVPPDVDSSATIVARITKGNFDSAPRVLNLTISYDWAWPRISSLRISAQIAHTALNPDAAFLNQAPLDPTKDFFPLGQKPAFNDTFYIASDEAFSKPRAAVTIDITVTTPRLGGVERAGLADRQGNQRQHRELHHHRKNRVDDAGYGRAARCERANTLLGARAPGRRRLRQGRRIHTGGPQRFDQGI
jgi:hypothetical protein